MFPSPHPRTSTAAVAAARAAFESGAWAETTPAQRGEILAKAAKLIEERSAELISHHLRRDGRAGVRRRDDAEDHVAGDAQLLREPGERVRVGGDPQRRVGQTKVYREPVGVVGAVVAWNVPCFPRREQAAPGPARSCTVVLKPAPETP
ncbi:aldehyde dehydrogenase family protein, partial [Rhodococcus hoagii]|nr:aldehyde dehydrogenase family protein [Prescottella equi]